MSDGPYYTIDAAAARELERIRRKVDGLAGPGVNNTREAITIIPPPQRRVLPSSPGGDGLAVKITAVSASFPIWTYTARRVTGYADGDYTTDDTDLTAYNGMEKAPASGYPYTYPIGVTVTASDGTVNSGSCKIQPIGVGAIVWAWPRGDGSYVFSQANSAQGA